MTWSWLKLETDHNLEVLFCRDDNGTKVAEFIIRRRMAQNSWFGDFDDLIRLCVQVRLGVSYQTRKNLIPSYLDQT